MGSGEPRPTKRTIYINFLDVASNYSLRSIGTLLREQSAKISSSLFFNEEEEEKEVGERAGASPHSKHFSRKCLFPSRFIAGRKLRALPTLFPSLLPRIGGMTRTRRNRTTIRVPIALEKRSSSSSFLVQSLGLPISRIERAIPRSRRN